MPVDGIWGRFSTRPYCVRAINRSVDQLESCVMYPHLFNHRLVTGGQTHEGVPVSSGRRCGYHFGECRVEIHTKRNSNGLTVVCPDCGKELPDIA